MFSAHAAAGKTWAFPWVHFVAAEHWREPAGETLRITFSSAEVVIKGTGLSPLLNAVTEFRLASVRVLPAEHRTMVRDSVPLVDSICVRVSGEV